MLCCQFCRDNDLVVNRTRVHSSGYTVWIDTFGYAVCILEVWIHSVHFRGMDTQCALDTECEFGARYTV